MDQRTDGRPIAVRSQTVGELRSTLGWLPLMGPGKEDVMSGATVSSSPEGGEAAYGWCGLCESFTDFPHECAAQDKPTEDEAA